MQCFTELAAPSAVAHSLSLPFILADEVNLVVAKTSLLQIFRTVSISVDVDTSKVESPTATRNNAITDRRANDEEGFESSFLVADAQLQRAERATSTKLVLVAEYALAGTITSMVRVNTAQSKSGGESILLGFKDAKLSLVEWDPQRHSLSTTSIHYYEQEDLEASPWAPKLGDCVNYLTVDPGSRCAALKFGLRNLAILPFKQSDNDVAMDEDWDEDLDGPRPQQNGDTQMTNGDANHVDTPYTSSFVLGLPTLDPALLHPIDIAFLYEYRDPTFGILSSKQYSCSSLLPERRDQVSYMVFTLDLHQRASTTILAVNNLPYDLFMIVPLPPPVGGALLVGYNEIIHVDQSGKTNGVAVNPFTKRCTSFALADQSDMELRLEGCKVEKLSDDGDMLIITRNAELIILSFRMDGRSVSGLNLRRVPDSILTARPSCTTILSDNRMFVGSEVGDSVLLGWSKKSGALQRRRSSAAMEGVISPDIDDDEEDGADDDDFDEDDLYGDEDTTTQVRNGVTKTTNGTDSKTGDYTFRLHDSQLSLGPIRDITLSRPFRPPPSSEDETADKADDTIQSELEIVLATGKDKSGALAILKEEIEPKAIGRFDFSEARGVWTLSAKKPVSKALQPDNNKNKETLEGQSGVEAEFDRLMIVSKAVDGQPEESAVYALTGVGFEALQGTEFEPAAGGSLEAGTLGNGMRIIQVLRSEVRSYDGDLGLSQILPMFDDETGLEPKIVTASIVDPYLLLVRDDASLFVAQCDDNNDLEEIEKVDDKLLATKWLSGSLYKDVKGVFSGEGSKADAEPMVYMFALSAEGSLFIYALPNLSRPVYSAEGLNLIPPALSPDYVVRRATTTEALTEIVVADIGDATAKSPHLILRASTDDLTIYQPFHVQSEGRTSMKETLHFTKLSNAHLAKNPDLAAEETADKVDETRFNPMRALTDIGGYSTVFLPGASPSFVLKSATSSVKVMPLRGAGVRGLSSFHTAGCDRGFIYVDVSGVCRVAQLPPSTDLTTIGMTVQRIPIGDDVSCVAYHPPKDVYVIGTSTHSAFQLPKDDDHHREWAKEELPGGFHPLIEQSTITLLSPLTWSPIQSIPLDQGEFITTIKTLNLEVSESTHVRKQLIVVGTGISKGEDLAIRGAIYVFDVIRVVPDPSRPETDRKLKLLAKEEIPRGAVTAISEIGTQGCMVVAQGQKLMVRGLKEDGTLLPVAFMDLQTVATDVKTLPGTGLYVVADALKGVWMCGYAEEPYRMLLFGKGRSDVRVVAAELLPVGGELFVVVVDEEAVVHVLQFDPEHPKSLQGHLLLPLATFSLGAGHSITNTLLLPRTSTPSVLSHLPIVPPSDHSSTPNHLILLTSTSGAIFTLAPVSESSYRLLSSLSTHLIPWLPHHAGLNPRAYRQAGGEETILGGRPVIDGSLVKRWMELGVQKRQEVAGRVGSGVEKIREVVEGLGQGLGYL